MTVLEEGFVRQTRVRLRGERVDLSPPDPAGADPDPAFVHATNWLLCEAGSDGVPEIAASSSGPSDPPSRRTLLELACQSGPDWEQDVERATRAYYEDVGYEASIAGALRAVCDLYFGRILTGAVHPAIGAGCIGWYSWMTNHLPDHDAVQACGDAWDKWTTSTQRAYIENDIRRSCVPDSGVERSS
jgi:hypothetical protein